MIVTVPWLAFLLCYVVLFYATPFSGSPADRPVARGAILWSVFTPEEYWRMWTGAPDMQVNVVDRAPVLLGAAATLATAYAAGMLCLTALGLHRCNLSLLENAVFAMGAGLNVLSLGVLSFGMMGWLRSSLLWLIAALIFTLLFGAVEFARFRTRKERSAMNVNGRDASEVRWVWLAAPFVVLLVLGGMLPPSDFDVREYHLQVPKEWFQHGRIDFLPHNVYGNMPLGAEMHAIPAMAVIGAERGWWWGALVGKTVIACFAPLTALMLLAAGRRFFSPWAGVAAGLVYLSVPWVIHTAMSGLNDHVLAFYVFLAFYALLLSWRENEAWRFLALAGFLAGAAAACKYTGLLFSVAPLGALAVGHELWNKSIRKRTGNYEARRGARGTHVLAVASVFTVAALAGCGLWYAKNWAMAGNPVYPLMVDVFGGRTRTAEKDAQWRRAHQVPRSEQSGPYSPRRLTEAVAQLGWRSDWLSPLLAPLLILTPFAARQRREIAWIAGMLVFLLAGWWLFTHRIDRFWIPALPLASLLAGAGAGWSGERRWRYVAVGVVAAGLLANFLVIASPLVGDNRFLVALDELRTDVRDPVTNPHGRVNPAHHYLNHHVPAEGGVLLVGDAQPFDLEGRVFYSTTFDSSIFEDLMKGRSTEARRTALTARNITHVLVDWAEIARYRSPGNYGFTDFVQPEVIEDLVKEKVLRPVWPEEFDDQTRRERLYPPSRVYEVMN